MRKFYSLIAAVAVVFSAAAAPPIQQLDVSRHQLKRTELKPTSSVVLKTPEKLPNGMARTSSIVSMKKVAELDGTPVSKTKQADGSYTIEGEYTLIINDCYFQTSVGIVTLNATVEKDTDGYWIIPDDEQEYFATDVPFTFDSTTNTLTFTPLSLGYQQNMQLYAAFYPIHWDNDTNSVKLDSSWKVNFNPETSEIEFPGSDYGFGWPVSPNQYFTTIQGWVGLFDVIGAYQELPEIDELQDGQWKSVGKAQFVDAWVLTGYKMSGNSIDPYQYEYEVDLEQNIANPNLYRLWMPYKNSGNPVASLNQSLYSGQIIIDISDPDHVAVVSGKMPAGFKDSNGEFYLSNDLGWYINKGYDKNLVISVIYGEGQTAVPSTYKDGVVTINKPMMDFDPSYSNGYNWTNNTYASRITFPKPEKEEPESVGSYDIYLQSVDIEGNTEDSVPVTIDVFKTDDTNYYIAEQGDGDYFKGQDIKFTLNSGQAKFDAYYAGQVDGKDAWIAAFVFSSMPEPQNEYQVNFDETTGFSFPAKSGIALYESSSTQDLEPTDVICAYYILNEAAEGNTSGGGEEGGNYPASIAAFAGTHTFAADVEFTENYKNIATITDAIKSKFEFEISGSTLTNFMIENSDIPLTYDSKTGVITLGKNNIGTLMNWDTYAGYDLGYANAEGEWTKPTAQGGPAPTWQGEEGDKIKIADFTIVDYRVNPAQVIAYFRNVTVDGYPEDGSTGSDNLGGGEGEGGDDNPGGSYPPALGEFDGTYTFTSEGYELLDSSKADKLPQTMEFSFVTSEYGDLTIQNFFVASAACNYDQATATISLNSAYFNPGGGFMGIVPKGSSWDGISNTERLKMHIEEDGSVTIPDFDIIDYTNPSNILAHYYNNVVTGEEKEDPGTGDNDGYPTLSQLVGDYSFSATIVDKNTAYTDYFEYLPEKFDFKIIDVYGIGITGFIVNGQINANYDDQTGEIKVTGNNGTIGTNYKIGFADAEGTWKGIGSMNTTFFWQANTDGTITIPDFTIIDTSNSSNPVICKYTNIKLNDEGEEPGEDKEYPAAGEFDGSYTYTCPNFKLNDQTYADVLKDTIEFKISTSEQGSVSVAGFFFTSVNADYDQETGELTLNQVYFTPAGFSSLGIAPTDGGWKGFAGLYANKMKWQIGEDGSITVPDFDIVTYNGTTATATIAEYRSGVVTESEGDEPGTGEDDKADYSNFVGDYVFKGTQTSYALAGSPIPTEDSEIENYLLRFSINEYGQIVEFNGKKLSEDRIGEKSITNKGILSDDNTVFTLEIDTFNGIEWNYGDEENAGAYTIYFGDGTKATSLEQGDTAFTLTKNEDGTYSLTDLSWILKYSVGTDDGNSSQNYYNTMVIWSDLTYFDGEEEPEPDFTGIENIVGTWSIPMSDYQEILSDQNVLFDVVLNGTTVTFLEQAESGDGVYNLVGEFLNNTTIKFDRAIVGDPNAKTPLRMIPFINNNGSKIKNGDMATLAEELLEQYEPVIATYDAESGTLTFPENSGVLYGYTDNSWAPSGSSFNPVGYWDTAFGFNGIGKQTKTTLTPEIKLTSQTFEIGKNSVTVSVEVELTYMDFSDVAKWTAQVNEFFNDVAGETEWTESTTVDVTVKDGVATFTIPDLANGNHDFQYSLTAFAADESNIATSNTRALSVVVGPNIMARNIQAEVDGGNITFTLQATVSGIDADELGSYKMRLLDNTTVTEDYAGDTQLIDAEYDETDGLYKAVLADQPNGRYDFTVVLLALDTQDNEIIASNNLLIVVDVTESGVSIIGADNNGDVRYFDLNGIEVRNPENGIFIKVEGQKASKIVVK